MNELIKLATYIEKVAKEEPDTIKRVAKYEVLSDIYNYIIDFQNQKK